jgi:hypothetical protein
VARIQRAFLYDEGEPKIEDLLRLTADQVHTLAAHVDQYGFSGTADELLSLAITLKLSYEKTADLIQFASYEAAQRQELIIQPLLVARCGIREDLCVSCSGANSSRGSHSSAAARRKMLSIEIFR